MENNAPFHAFESNDPALFAAYVELRRNVFHLHYEDLDKDFGDPDETDDVSRLVYLFQGSEFAGGARLTIATPSLPVQLPLEEKGFLLRECGAMKHLALNQNPYAEISRMAIDPAHSRDFDASLTLAAELCRVAAANSVDAIFSICPAAAARLNRHNAHKLGLTYVLYPKIPTSYEREMWVCSFTNILSAMGEHLLCA